MVLDSFPCIPEITQYMTSTCTICYCMGSITAKPVLKGLSKKDRTKVLKTSCSKCRTVISAADISEWDALATNISAMENASVHA